ncbi:MAG: YfhL family 4Fe-4S dicluster ferredoxin [Deltaproteobacteria bacterium]|nr:YfhL family 4Fe-4S dicluster ferredoxin [Deltaproteobacteria bacterium]MBW2414908.1 YfhL family 4Fe-4S dicluster ferredoxin [Deltaproteobacteria bacterium]
MSNMITEQCFNCGVCERMCPAGGISRGEETFVIDPARCTECVGFHHVQQCARVCPIDCCVIDPNNAETEAVLFERAQGVHSGSAGALVLGPETSHFQADDRTLGSALKRVGRRINQALQGPSSRASA